jgi:hypothetical protein
MLVFLSHENPLWGDIFRGTRNQYKKGELRSVIADGSMNNLRKGYGVTPKTFDQTFKKSLAAIDKHVHDAEKAATLKKRVQRFREAFQRDPEGFRIYAAANMLEMEIEDAQTAIDSAIYARLPVFPDLFYDVDVKSRLAEADEDLRDFGGVYHLWIKRRVQRRGLFWLRAPLRVRYKLDIAAGRALRCKLNLPVIESKKYSEAIAGTEHEGSSQRWFEYDGFLAVRRDLGGGGRLIWIFEKRTLPQDQMIHPRRRAHSADRRQDYFFIITSLGAVGKSRIKTFHGKYLTVGQTKPERLIQSDDVVMQRLALSDAGARLNGMRSAKVLTAQEARLPERLLRESQRHARR